MVVVLVLSLGGVGRAAPHSLRPAPAAGAANAGEASSVDALSTAYGRLASGSAPGAVTALGVSQSTGIVYAAAAGGLYRSDAPSYQTWTRVNTLAHVPRPVRGLYPNPTAAGDLFILAGNGSAYASADGGATLAPRTVFPYNTVQVTGLAWALPDPHSPSVTSSADVSRLYATGTDDYSDGAFVARSDDGGATWRLVLSEYGDAVPPTISALAVAPGHGGSTVLIAESVFHGGDLAETTDGGATWNGPPSDFDTPPPPDYVAVSPTDAASIWTWWDDALWHSADGGHTWPKADTGIADYSAASTLDLAMRFLPRQQLALLRVNADLYRSLPGPGGGWARVPGLGRLGSPIATVWRSGYLIATTAAGRLLALSAARLPGALGRLPTPPCRSGAARPPRC